jgi:hypothetical protein
VQRRELVSALATTQDQRFVRPSFEAHDAVEAHLERLCRDVVQPHTKQVDQAWRDDLEFAEAQQRHMKALGRERASRQAQLATQAQSQMACSLGRRRFQKGPNKKPVGLQQVSVRSFSPPPMTHRYLLRPNCFLGEP